MKAGIGLGNVLAFIISFNKWGSLLGALFHGIFGWWYVLYYGLFYWGRNY